MKNVIILCGPTASGKTDLSLEISKSMPCEIISADSRQIYKFLNIGTAKPSVEEMAVVPHHFIDVINPDEHFDAGDFGEQGRKTIDDIFNRKKIPLVVGGSGLYIRSLVDGLFEGPKKDDEIRKDLEKKAAVLGLERLLRDLEEVDPETYSKIDKQNKPRIIRALEVYYITKTPLSVLQKENKIEINFNPVFFGINWVRDLLYKRVNTRTEKMFKDGLLEEVKELQKTGYHKDLKSLQTVGYKECFEHLEGKISSGDMIKYTQQNTRHYVKRQMTWFNHEERIKWINLSNESDFKSAAKTILDQIEKQ